jgi:hypothetical protein
MVPAENLNFVELLVKIKVIDFLILAFLANY